MSLNDVVAVFLTLIALAVIVWMCATIVWIFVALVVALCRRILHRVRDVWRRLGEADAKSR